MSRIAELIAERCPNGVEFKSLGEVGAFIRGNGLQKKDLVDEGVGAIHYGQIHTHYGTWAAETASFVTEASATKLRKAKPGDLVVVTTSEDDNAVAKAVAWLGTEDVAVSSDAYIYHHELDPKYVAYFFQSRQFQDQKQRYITGTKVRRISGDALAKIRIPVPPSEVQRAIVSVLDTFTALEAELEAELEARRRQHTLYWNRLLTPDEGWRRTTIGEITDVFDGPHATPTKTDHGPWYLSISSLVNGRFELAESARLSDAEYQTWTRRVAARRGDTMFSYETRLGQAAYWDSDEPAALGRRMGLLRPKESMVHPPFLTLAYLGPEFQRLIQSKTVHGATVDRIPIGDMPSWPISIPSIREQQGIVAILDRFDALVNDLSIGLPAELAARRKQYEHYRDRLLTFPEAA